LGSYREESKKKAIDKKGRRGKRKEKVKRNE
jgi:hypothetical protein